MNPVKKHEYICLDGVTRSYTEKKLQKLHAAISKRIAKVMEKCQGFPLTRDVLRSDAKYERLENKVPKSSSSNVFIDCSFSITPTIIVSFSLLEAIFPEQTPTLFPEPIGYKVTASTDFSLPHFGTICRAGDVIELRELKECAEGLEVTVICSNKVYEERILSFGLEGGQVAIPLWEAEGKIELDGKVHLKGASIDLKEIGWIFDTDEFLQGENNIYIHSPLHIRPALLQTPKTLVNTLTSTCRETIFPYSTTGDDFD